MSDQDRKYTKSELLERMAASRGVIEQAIAGKDEATLTKPGDDGWSAKDHLAHLTIWQRSLIALLEGKSRAAALGVDEATYRDGGFEKINDLVHERVKDAPLDQVLSDFQTSRVDLLAVLDGLTDEDLYRPYSDFQPDDLPRNENPVMNWIAGNTFGHEEEHLDWFSGLLN